jgi:hypothetical protein
MPSTSITQKPKYQRSTKAEAGYVDYAQSTECCEDCSMFGPGTCDDVEGSISPRGWCRLFQPSHHQGRKATR